jgi:hypothetical protein
MKLSNFSVPVLRDAFVTAMSRFPVALSSSFAFGILSIYLVEYHKESTELHRILFSLGIGLPWLTGLHLFAENYLKSFSQKLILFSTGILFLVLIYFFIAPDFDSTRMERPVRFLSFFLISHLLISLAAFMKSGYINRFWEFNKDALIIWIVGVLYALLIYLGLLAALFAIDNLFDAHIGYELYLDIFIIMSAGFHPVYVLSNLPKTDETEPNQVSYTKVIRLICFYIMIPLTILYFLILYAYGFKIVAAWELPHGWVSSLVLGFSGIGMITYLLNYRLPHLEDNKLSFLFKKYFFYILTPLVILLFVAINRRLSDYGFTPPRYFVLITGVWLFLSCIYFILSKTDNIKLIPFSLILFLLFGTMSPFDAFRTSSSSQYNRLVSMLEEKQFLENGKLKTNLASLTYDQKDSIKNIIYALDDLGDLNKVNGLLTEAIPIDTITYYDAREFLFEKLGLSQSSAIKNKTETIYLSSQEKNDYPVSGFDHFVLFNLNVNGTDDKMGLNEIQGRSILICSEPVDTIPLDDLLKTIDEKYQKSGNEGILESPFDISTPTHKHLLYIKHLNYQKFESNLSIDYLHGVLLTGKK